MPAPTSEPQPGWLAAALGAAGIALGAALKGAFDALTGKWQRQTTLEVKAVDSHEAYADDLREDVKTLRQEFREAQVAMDTLRRESESERKTSQLQMDALRNEGIEKNKRIAHLEMEIERLTYQLGRMQDEGHEREHQHEVTVAKLHVALKEKDATIESLRQQIADLEVIGVGEKAPPKRMKETTE